MACESNNSLQMFVDNELDAPESKRVGDHLRECAGCSRELANVVRVKRATRQAGQRFAPSAALQRKIMAQYASPAVKPARRWWSMVALAVPTLAAIVLAMALFMVLDRERGEAAGRELADLHVATVASEHPVDVVSTDKHTVKPWFAGKVPFTFNVPELQGSAYELVGGRMAYLNDAPAAQLFFNYGKHRVSVFIAQERSVSHRGISAPNNFTEIHWSVNGLSWFLVTDASPNTMTDLVERCKKAAGTT